MRCRSTATTSSSMCSCSVPSIKTNTMKKLIFILTVWVSIHAQAGDTIPGRKLRYGGLQQFGLRFSQNSTRPVLTLINGVHYRKWYIGLGADYGGGGNPYYNHMNNS